MKINVNYLENLKLEACFDDFNVVADQPIRYKGDGSAPGPFDYFLASSVMCAAYFVKVYCNARNISTEGISLSQNNIINPENRYKQDFILEIELPDHISKKDREGILNSMDRCTVKRVIQNNPEFIIKEKESFKEDKNVILDALNLTGKTTIIGKDAPLEESAKKLMAILKDIGISIETAAWRNPIPHVWSVHIRDADCPMCYTNGKGATKEAALCSALGEYLERLSTNYFYSDYYLGSELSNLDFVHYPNEKWFEIPNDKSIPKDLMDEKLLGIYNNSGELNALHLLDHNSANAERGICALPFKRLTDNDWVYIPVSILSNLYVSNGMSAGNSKYEARVQALSEIFERAIKSQIISEEISLPTIEKEYLKQHPSIIEGIETLEDLGYPVLVKDASLGGKYPVCCVCLMNPKTGGVFASFGAHPCFESALERSLTELLQGRSFEGLNDIAAPSLNQFAIKEHNNLVEHFIDSNGVISWKFFSNKADYEFSEWGFKGDTKEQFNYLMDIFKQINKEVYISDYEDLGFNACRIIVPDFSEIYPIEDLLWENNNRSLVFREDILNIHRLTNENISNLLEKLDEYEIDEHMNVSELIGVAFEEFSNWGQLVISELKALCFIQINDYENALESLDLFLNFNESTPSRKNFYQLLKTYLEIKLDPTLYLDNFMESFTSMFGSENLSLVNKLIENNAFIDLPETNLNLDGIKKHQDLLASYKKIRNKRKDYYVQ